MLIYKNTSTLDGYLPQLEYTEDREAAQIMLVGGKNFNLSDFPELLGIFKTGIGTDNLPFSEANDRGVAICLPSESTREIVYEETAGFTCHLILNGLYSNLGDWDRWHKFTRDQLASRSLLVIGSGHIGSRVINKMSAFMTVDSFDITSNTQEELEPKLRSVDCVSLHIPLNEDTKGFFNKERLSWLKDDALIVNTARGPVIEEDSLYEELTTGRLRAALDVFWQEPYHGRLNKLPPDRFIRTPHVASTCKEFITATAKDFLEFVSQVKEGLVRQ